MTPVGRPSVIRDGAGQTGIINAHEHFQSIRLVPKYLQAMGRNNVDKTVVVGSPEATILRGRSGFANEEKYNLEVIRMARAYPDRFVAFPTLDPGAPDKLENLKLYLEMGARGLKLYSGHSQFHNLPLDHEAMSPVYKFCVDKRIPVLFHVNAGLYLKEFEAVLNRFPGLNIICPHLCLSTKDTTRFEHLMDAYPGLYTDASMGLIDFLKEALLRFSKNPSKFRDLFVRYNDRILFGTDNVITDAPHKTVDWIDMMTRVYRNLLEKESYVFLPLGDEPLQGLHLGADVLRNIYRSNFERFLARGH